MGKVVYYYLCAFYLLVAFSLFDVGKINLLIPKEWEDVEMELDDRR